VTPEHPKTSDAGPGPSPLVSVVTPVFNGEPYLRECIESVLAQTHTNWDYTIVNNCSTDGTRDIAEEYVRRDSRIRLHNNTVFQRQMANFNIAIRQVSPHSKYCKMVLADDWLFPDCLTKMVAVAEAHPTVAIVSTYGVRGGTVLQTGLPYPSTFLSGRDVCRIRLLRGPYVFGTPTSLLYRADIVRSRESFFNESNIHADAEVCFDFLRYHDFGFVHQILTFIRPSDESFESFSKSLNTYLAGELLVLLKYGPAFLTEREMAEQLALQMKSYYHFFCESLFRPHDPRLWDYHRKKLRELGMPLSYTRLSRLIGIRILDLLLNPKRAVEALWRRCVRAAHHAGRPGEAR
jgi:glycosyltransferase involved in cell wall biosynthesis